MKPRVLETAADIALLTPAEFQRFLPDFIAWHTSVWALAELLDCPTSEVGVKAIHWLDDGMPGVLQSVKVNGQEILHRSSPPEQDKEPQ